MQCPGCGAPLRWTGQAPVVECRYCKTHVATGNGTKTGAAAHAVSARTVKHQALFVLLPVGAALVIFAVIGAIASRAATTSFGPSVELAKISAFSLASTQAQAVETLDGKQSSEGLVLVHVDGLSYNSVQFEWKEQHPEHVVGVNMFILGSRTNPQRDKILWAMRKQLGRKLKKTKKGYDYKAPGVWLHVSDNAESVSVRTDPDSDVYWKDRLQLAWSVLLANAQGKVVQLGDAKRKGLLGLGFTTQELARLDPRTTLDDATSSLEKLFPGMLRNPKGSNTYEIPVRHPVFDHVRLTWDNAEGGKLQTATFFVSSAEPTIPNHGGVAKCIGNRAGQMEERVQDHARGIKSYQWKTPKLGGLMLGRHNLTIQVYGWLPKGKHPSQESWKSVLSVVGSCPATK